MKRLFDILISLVSLIVLSPLLIIISILIKVTTKGPIFFVQRRVGRYDSEFKMIKFRTMIIDTPNVATDMLDDPDRYITTIGKFLRSTSLDELPQLINILKGNMSFVGPRPALYNQVDLNEERKEHGINKLVPGLTGWAQINGRDTIELKEKVKLDKEYLENKTVLFDLKIIYLTFWRVVTKKDVREGKVSR